MYILKRKRGIKSVDLMKIMEKERVSFLVALKALFSNNDIAQEMSAEEEKEVQELLKNEAKEIEKIENEILGTSSSSKKGSNFGSSLKIDETSKNEVKVEKVQKEQEKEEELER